MITLNRFGLSNFRVFKEYTEFEFAPITVLTGANNSGKSSLLKALLLVQDNAKRNGLKELEFDGGEHNLGSWEFTKNKFSDSEVMEFGIGFKNVESDWFLMEYIENFTNKIRFRNKVLDSENSSLSVKIKNQVVVNNCADFESAILNQLTPKLREEWESNSDFFSLFFENLREDLVYEDPKFQIYIDEEASYFIVNYFNIEYLGVSRGKQEHAYQHSKKDSALADLLVQFLKSNFAQDSKAQVFINKWLNTFGLAEKVVFQPIMKDVYTSIIFYKNGIELNISDLGFGITQLLPLLLKIVMCENQMLLLEEPETNLHPTLQSRLAELFVDAYRTFNIQFIIETHSEYLIRRLQVLTAKYEEARRKEQDTQAFISPEESVIYYFYEPDKVPKGKKQVEKINIMVDGRLDNGFGDGFVDEATQQKFELMQLTTLINEPQTPYQTHKS